MSTLSETKTITVPWVKAQKGKNKIAMLTAYDYPTAQMLDEVGVEVLLVGDSLATVLYGEPNTLSVTMEDMLRHTAVVAKAAKRALVIGDMPFMSYQLSKEQALLNAGKFLKEARAQAVKLEGGIEMADTIKALTRAGIPVCAHIGLTPQSVHAMGKYRMHGKSEEERNYLIDSAHAVENAGAFCVVLECVKEDLAKEITDAISIPTIGIGASEECDGQVLVTNDLLGLNPGKVPRFVKQTANLKEDLKVGVRSYISRTKGKGEEIDMTGIRPGLATPPPFRKDLHVARH